MNCKRLDGKIVVVTGGAGVIGKAFIESIAINGGVAIAADIDVDAATLFAEQCKAGQLGIVDAEILDITNQESIQKLIDKIVNRYGKIDAVVNNAYPRNKNYGRKLEDVTYSDFCDNVDNHLGGYFLVAQQFSKLFIKQGSGNIINMSSIYGSVAPRFNVYEGTHMTMPVEYAAIKSAVEHLTRYFAQYYKKLGIRVNSISPGGVFADQSSDFVTEYKKHCGVKGMLSSEDVTGALLFLLSNDAEFITGQNLIVDDGFSL
jgi:NAD(P)-dependent dehydrogenase (short-subunit alcohol dehydrogenase family)